MIIYKSVRTVSSGRRFVLLAVSRRAYLTAALRPDELVCAADVLLGNSLPMVFWLVANWLIDEYNKGIKIRIVEGTKKILVLRDVTFACSRGGFITIPFINIIPLLQYQAVILAFTLEAFYHIVHILAASGDGLIQSLRLEAVMMRL
jgi:hypothetical protein